MSDAAVAVDSEQWRDLWRNNGDQFRIWFETNPLPTLIFDRRTLVFLAVNEAAIHDYGYSREEFLSKKLQDLHPLKDVPRLMEVAGNLEAGEVPKEGYTWKHLKADGTPIDVEVAVHAFEFASQAACLGIVRDITERKCTEATLREAQRRLEFLRETSPALTYVCSISDDFPRTFISRDVTLKLGYDPDEVLSNPRFWVDHLHPDDKQRVLAEVIRLSESDRCSVEYRFQHKDGTWRWIQDEIRLVRDKAGHPTEVVGYWVDTTERKRAEASVKTSEECYRVLFDTSPLPMFVLDSESLSFLAINQAAIRHYGYTREEFLGMTLRQIRPAEDAPFLFEYQPTLTPGLNKPVLGRHRKKNGTLIDVEVALEPIPWEGRPAWLILANDISERTKADQRARESEMKYRALVEQMPAVTYIATVDELSTTLFVSPQIETWLGIPQSEWLSDSGLFLNQVHPDDRKRLQTELASSHATGKPFRCEYRLRTRNGGVVWVRDEAIVVRGESGRPDYIQGVMYDVTERKHAEEALRESELRFRQVSENMPDILWIFSPDGKQALYVNPAFEKITGLPCESLYDRSDSLDFIHAEDRARALESFSQQALGASSEGEEFRLQRPDGSVRWARSRIFPIRNQYGEVYCIGGVAEDITDRKHTEDALRASEARLAEAQRIAHLGSWEWDVRTGDIHWSDEAYRLLGLRPNEIDPKGDIFFKSIHPDDSEFVRRSIDDALEGKKSYEVDFRILRKGGTERVLHARGEVFRDQGGRPVRLVGTSLDITDRKMGQEALREAEKKYHDIFANAVEGIFQTSEDGRFLAANPAMARIYSYESPEELIREVTDISRQLYVHPEQREEILRKVKERGAVWGIELQHRRRDGSIVWVLESVRIVRDAAGATLYYEGTVQSINDRKRMEEALRESEDRFRLLVEGVKDCAMFLLDPNGRVLSWNTGAKRLKGYDEDEIIGKAFTIFHPSENIQAGTPERLLKEAAAKGHCEDEGWRVRKDGSRFWANVAITRLDDESGNMRGFAMVTRDITERRRAEEGMRELSGRLLRLQDEERRRIARELHDSTAQALAALKMNLGGLAKSSSGLLNSKAQKALSESISLAMEASREIRTLSYLLHPPLLDEFGLASALRWYIEGFRRRSGVQVHLSVSEELARLPQGIETAIFRVVQEALTNIHHHSGSKRAEIRLGRQPDEIRLEVRDNGKGIPLRVLRSFNRGTAAGLGVGIRGMRERVTQLGGQLKIHSGRKGSRVVAVLPVLDAKDE